ncbi:MAG: hypothetical protein A3I44_04630 [Candidatus Sungbacteria bacterium RIFCSPLOWO2_02_FULL_51_17]|uniref:Ribulose-phosphate 3-epimerase n=1 Tax=Candidatus Sungbacteria bacterium RIFCSPHIGHO2_02_FULL_51_29 TaxID=1802273 RepID=A0A1G2KVI3_9BACT|nr:MAG: hypothetical protein A2676_05355 [Candidatus Sungbacteria bacterium RIFCSPHIGHO2_01_FULL_51_22]OHA03426.1 MAG: hypothetical protein A3C16_00085 [Candidatus Sungbacteria bacterium RIFCSPHIGHO2_02_FULL_51_29]OHA07901.1 MAG: hypothetical protein A3B29_04955 [Candidatus Sungbacteria bacterium RIFCSPLOWO2_01_FULL_51_34]OHA12455.1 MAG: hypothetical protein A3I44_04630 [Candidatus Sungbacteria bacterium RIFCSPLOWO2_02_FULL_51_17]
MIEIIPSINEKTWKEVARKIRRVEPFVTWVHLDVADGTFTPNILWNNPFDLYHLPTDLKFEIHMMEDDPEVHLPAWLMPNVKRIIVHYETTTAIQHIIDECHAHRTEVALAIADPTSWTVLKPWRYKVDMLQVLSVPAGSAGQHFRSHNLSKIKHLRAYLPDGKIEVDGGMNPETAREAIRAGANVIVAASHIFNHKDIPQALAELHGDR